MVFSSQLGELNSIAKVAEACHDNAFGAQQLRDWHHEVNEERPCRATGIIPALRLAEEAPRLRTLKVPPELWNVGRKSRTGSFSRGQLLFNAGRWLEKAQPARKDTVLSRRLRFEPFQLRGPAWFYLDFHIVGPRSTASMLHKRILLTALGAPMHRLRGAYLLIGCITLKISKIKFPNFC
jgi:hypothetical protein